MSLQELKDKYAQRPQPITTPPQLLQPGDKVLVEAEYLFSNIRNEHTLQMRQGICCYDVLKGFCITVPLSSIRPFPQEEAE